MMKYISVPRCILLALMLAASSPSIVRAQGAGADSLRLGSAAGGSAWLLLPPSASANYRWLLPSSLGSSNSQLMYTNGLTGQMSLLTPGADGTLLKMSGGSFSWVLPDVIFPTVGWSLLGNTATNPLLNFLGTTDAQPLRFVTNSSERMRISASGLIGIGTSSASQLLHLAGGNLLIDTSSSGNAGELRLQNPARTFYTALKSGATTSNVTYTLPTADGTSGQMLSTNGSGALSWATPSTVATSVPLSGLTAATATNSINNAAFGQTWQWNTLAGSSALSLSSSSTAAASNAQTLLNLSLSGANGTSTQTTYGMQVANTHTGTAATNVAGYFSASGGSNNYALLAPNGNVGIGTSSPTSVLHVNGASRFSGGNMIIDTSAASTAGQLQFYNPARSFYTALKAGANAANVTYTLPTADGTSGQILSTDGSGALSWTTPAAGTVTGSGTATRVAFWNSSSALSSSANLYWDNTNSRLGIGTTSPSQSITSTGNIELTSASSKITGSGGNLTLEETGDTYGTVRLNLQNRNGVNGALFEQAGSVDLVDFVFKGLANQRNIRFENRVASSFITNPEFQIGTAGDPTFVTTDNASAFRKGTLAVGKASITSGLTLEATGHLGLSNSGTASELRLYEPSASGTDYTALKAQAQAASVSYTLPAADGTSGQVLSTNGSGLMSWTTPSTVATSVPISGLTAATATNSINNAAFGQTWQWNSLAGTSALTLSSSSTAAASNAQTLLNLSLSGANGTTTQTTYGMQVANTHTGTAATNVAGYFSASGGTNNYALLAPSGNVGIGTSVPTSVLHVNGASRFSGGNMVIDTSASATAGQLQFYNPARTFYTALKAGANAANVTYTLPTADGSSGQVLSTNGSGTMSWATPSTVATSVPISGLTAAGATNSINNADFAQTWQWNTLSSNTALSLSSSSTAAASNTQKLLGLSLSGANGTASQTTYGLYTTNTHTGTTSTNVGGYFSASGATNNYALVAPSGNVGIGTATPGSTLHVNGASLFAGGAISIDTTSSGTAGQLQFYNPARTFYTALKAGANAANVTYTLPTADGSSGQMLSTNGSGALSWATPSTTATSVPISGLTAATATNSINNAAFGQTWQWNTLAGTSALTLSSSSTAAASNAQTLLNLSLSGANGTTTQTTYGMQVANTHTGTSATNIAAYFSASGGTNNYALLAPSGNVGIGTSAPTSVLHVNGASRFSGGNMIIDTSASATAGQIQFYNPARTFYTALKAGANAANVTYTLPTADGSSGQVLSTNGSGALSWANAASSSALSSITAAGATNSINNADFAQTWQWNTLSSNTALSLSSSSTAAASNTQKLLGLSLSGANGTASQTTYGLYATNTHTGTTSTNVGGYFSASGATNNYALLAPSGYVGIGTATPASTLHVNGPSLFAGGALTIDTASSGIAGQLQFYNPARTFYTALKAGANAANVTYTLPTADGSSGQMLSTNGSGALSWATPSTTATSVPISGLTAATATNSINNAAFGQTWQWNTLAGTSALTLSSSSTAAASNAQTLLNLSLSGANGTTTQTTYGMQVANTHTGTSATNIAGYFSASGGTNNYALLAPSGNVGIGTSAPTSVLHVNGASRFSGGNMIIDTSASATAGQIQFYNPARTFYTALKAGANAANVTYTLPTADGTSGQVLSTNGSGTLSWATSTSSKHLSSITAGTATNTINSTSFAQTWQWNSLAGATALTLSSSSTAAAGNAQTLLNLSLSGANSTTTQTTYGAQISNTHTGTSATNVGMTISASGGTNNYALLVPSGSVGIGTSSPTSALHVNGASRFSGGNMIIDTSAASTAGQVQFYNPARTFYTAFKAGANAANVTYTLPTADATTAGQVLSSDAAGTLSWSSSGASITYGVNTPSAYGANQNNLSLVSSGNSVYRISSSLAIDITGIVAASDGRQITLINVGSSAITLKVQSASSTATNRFILRATADAVMNTDDAITLIYDNTTGRWREVNRSF